MPPPMRRSRTPPSMRGRASDSMGGSRKRTGGGSLGGARERQHPSHYMRRFPQAENLSTATGFTQSHHNPRHPKASRTTKRPPRSARPPISVGTRQGNSEVQHQPPAIKRGLLRGRGSRLGRCIHRDDFARKNHRSIRRDIGCAPQRHDLTPDQGFTLRSIDHLI